MNNGETTLQVSEGSIMPKLDHRTTDDKLTAALIELLEGENLYRVQVSELCAHARVNRSTFYKHYRDIPEFVSRLEKSFLDRMNDAFFFGNTFIHAINIDAYQTFLQCVRFMQGESRPLVRALLGPNGSSSFRNQVVTMWAAQAEEALLMRDPSVQERCNLELLSTCIATSMMGLLDLHLSKPSKYEDEYLAEQMALILHDRLLMT